MDDNEFIQPEERLLVERMSKTFTYYDMAEAFCEGGLAFTKMIQLAQYEQPPGPKELRKAFDRWLGEKNNGSPKA
jgi:hypothetical protein